MAQNIATHHMRNGPGPSRISSTECISFSAVGTTGTVGVVTLLEPSR